MARGDLTDGEWSSRSLPIGERGPYPHRLREQFDGVMWRFRTGSPWRDMPERYGARQTVYHRFEEWALAGTFQTLMEGMIAEAALRGQVDMSLVSVDG